jgi:WD40 repeat protein
MTTPSISTPEGTTVGIFSKKLMLTAGLATLAAAALSGSVSPASAAACSSPYVKGDVFASAGSGTVDVFTPTGASVCTLSEGAGGALFPSGSGFDKAGNFYLANFDAAGLGVAKFNNSGGLVAVTFMAPAAQANPESVRPISAGPQSGSAFVGGPGFGGPGSNKIDQYSTATGALIKSWTVLGGNGTGGTDWVDLMPDGHTLVYDGEGSVIRTFDLATNTQGPDFATVPVGLFELRAIPSGAFKGDVLATDSADVILLNSAGSIIKTYTLPGSGGTVESLDLDPNGTDFWTGDNATGNVWQVNIATGAIDEQWNTGAGHNFLGLSVFGGTGATPTVPEPSVWTLMLLGLAGLGCAMRRSRGDRIAEITSA